MVENTMIFEASFYLNDPASAKLIMAFADTLGGRLNGMSITDTALRSRNSRPDLDKLTKALSDTSDVQHIILFQKGKDGNNNDPECYVQLARLSATPESEEVFSLAAAAPDDEQDKLAPLWWALAAKANINAGAGVLQNRPNTQINYGQLTGSRPRDPGPVWKAFDEACLRYMTDPISFKPVVKGDMLRNVLLHNFMTASLSLKVREVLDQAGLATDGFVDYPKDHVVWSVPDTQLQRAAHKALFDQGMVWEPVWLDLAAYIPAP